MASLNESIAAQNLAIASMQNKVLSLTSSAILLAALGEVILYGCKVTQGVSATDMVVALEGLASGDTAALNPRGIASPVRAYEYYNIASLLDGAFTSQDLTATVADPPATTLGRYDIAYIYVGPSGAGFAVATGTASTGVATTFASSGLNTAAYDPLTEIALPVGAFPVARIYVSDTVTGIPNARIADLRRFYRPPLRKVYTVPNTNHTLRAANGDYQTMTVTAIRTFTDGLVSGDMINKFHLEGGVAFPPVWPTIKWVGSSTLAAKCVLEFWKVGSTLYGRVLGSYT